MSADTIVGIVTFVVVVIYLFYALLRPDRF